jgi:ABC-type multidrug transport system fused ATPase/permease subunit
VTTSSVACSALFRRLLRQARPYTPHTGGLLLLSPRLSLLTLLVAQSGMIYVTFPTDWQLGLVALAASPFHFLSAWPYARRLRQQWCKIYQFDGYTLSVAQDALTAIRVVKAYGWEIHEGERFVHRSRESMRARIRASFTEAGLPGSRLPQLEWFCFSGERPGAM